MRNIVLRVDVDPVPACRIATGEVDLWFCFPGEITDSALLQAYERMISPEERRRWTRYHSEDRHQFLVTRALVRVILSRYARVAAGSWRYDRNRNGRPHIAAQSLFPPLSFNLSHTDGLAACAVSLTPEVGVDVEKCRRLEDSKLAERFFSLSETRDLRALPEQAQEGRFFDYWTLKESYIKARGLGLPLPLDQFSFRLRRGDPIRISFDSALRDDPSGWQCWLLQPTATHRAALAVRKSSGVHRLRTRIIVPLREESAVEAGRGSS